MTDRRDGLGQQSYPMHQYHQRRVCKTPGCYTFVMDRVGDLCVACKLDEDITPPRMGRPRNDRNTLSARDD